MTAPALGQAPQPLRTVTPGLGVNIGVDIGNELMTGSKLGIDTAGNNTSSSTFLSADTVQVAKIALTAAQINGMNAAPVQIVAAPGAGLSVVVDKAMLRFVHGGAAFKAGGAVSLEYDNTAAAGGTLATATIAAGQVTAGADSDNVIVGVSGVATQNKGIFISNDTAAFTTGTGTATVFAWYKIV